MTRVRFNFTDFVFAHGKMPRGVGRWAFFFRRSDDVSKAFWFNGSFAEAKKAAAQEAKRRGAEDVFVGS